MPSAPSNFDPSIPLQVKGPLDNLGGLEGAIGLAGRLQLGKMAQQSIGPDGTVDYDKLLSSAAQDPFTVQYINPLRQAQLTQRQITGLVQTQNAQNWKDINTVFASSANNPAMLGPGLAGLLSRIPVANRPAAMQYIQAIGQGVSQRNGQPIDLSTPQGQADFKANLLPLAAAADMNATQMGIANLPPSAVAMGYTSPTEAYKPTQTGLDPFANVVTGTAAQFARRATGTTPPSPVGGNALGGTGAPNTTLGPNGQPPGIVTQLGPGEQKRYDNAADYEQDLNKAVDSLRPIALAMKVERAASQQFQMGGGAEQRAAVGKMLQGLRDAGFPLPESLIEKVANGSIADTQSFQAAMTPIIMGQYKSGVQGTGRGFMVEVDQYLKKYPNIGTDPRAYETISNMLSTGFDQLVNQQQQLPVFRSLLAEGKLPRGTTIADFPRWYNAQLIAKGQLTFPQFNAAKRPPGVAPANEGGQTVPIQGGKRRPLSEIFRAGQ